MCYKENLLKKVGMQFEFDSDFKNKRKTSFLIFSKMVFEHAKNYNLLDSNCIFDIKLGKSDSQKIFKILSQIYSNKCITNQNNTV